MTNVVVRASPIAGLGVFVLDGIRAGEVVCEFRLEREVTPDAPL